MDSELELFSCHTNVNNHHPDSKVHGANMGPIWGRQDPGGSYVGPNELCYLDMQGYCWCLGSNNGQRISSQLDDVNEIVEYTDG